MVGSPSLATDPISRSCVTRIYALSRRGCFTNCSEQSARRKSTMPSSVRRWIFPISEICRSWKWRADSDQKFCNRAIAKLRNHSKSGRALEICGWLVSRRDERTGKLWNAKTRTGALGSLVSLSLFARDTLKAIADIGKTEFQKV